MDVCFQNLLTVIIFLIGYFILKWASTTVIQRFALSNALINSAIVFILQRLLTFTFETYELD